MLYLPAVSAVVLLVRALLALSKKAGAGGEKTVRPGRTFVGANFAPFLFYMIVVFPACLIPSFVVDDSDLPAMAKLLGGPWLVAGSFYFATLLPHWLAWRVAGPWGAVRAGRACFSAALFRRDGDREGARELYTARFGRGWDRRLPAASPWTIAAAALQAETEGDPERADALLGLLGRRYEKTRRFRRARAIAAECLAASAARRGEWKRAGERAASGPGRGIWLLRRAAAAHLGRPVSKPLLLLAWVLAPGRIAAFSWVQSALAALDAGRRSAAPESEPGPAVDVDRLGPHLGHLHLLARAAQGLPVKTGEVESLARAWNGALSPEAGARLVRRALELGGQNLVDLPPSLEQSIFAELEILAEVAQGTWSGGLEGEKDGDAAAPLARRRIHRAFEAVREEIEAFERPAEAGAKSRPMASALEELERWLGFRAKVEHLVEVGGEEALATAWHNDLRTTACNWPVFLARQRGGATRWATFLMHHWSAEIAGRVGDEGIAALSAKNAEGVRPYLL